jgi:hypothetical protein
MSRVVDGWSLRSASNQAQEPRFHEVFSRFLARKKHGHVGVVAFHAAMLVQLGAKAAFRTDPQCACRPKGIGKIVHLINYLV